MSPRADYMFRLSIASVLCLIALAALNFAILRSFEYLVSDGPGPIIPLAGLMPLFDVFLISSHAALTKRYRFTLIRRSDGRDFAKTFAMTSGVMLAFCIFLCFALTHGLLVLIEDLLMPFDKWLKNMGRQGDGGALIGSAMCVFMLGPLIVMTTLLALIMSRYRLVMALRPRDSGDWPLTAVPTVSCPLVGRLP
jgi:hypothetical protein